MSSRPHPRQNPARAFAASRASASTLRPCAPTEQPTASLRTYRCTAGKCRASIQLTPADPLPADWSTVLIPAGRGAAERIGYRCGRCRRLALVEELLADDIALRTVAIADARRLARWCEARGLDDRGICTVIRRLQAERGAEAWAGIEAMMGGAGETP